MYICLAPRGAEQVSLGDVVHAAQPTHVCSTPALWVLLPPTPPPALCPSLEVLALARSAAGPNVSDALIFDLYEGEGVAENEKSLAIGLTFRDQSRTLTDEEISESLTQVIVSLQEKLGAKLRH